MSSSTPHITHGSGALIEQTGSKYKETSEGDLTASVRYIIDAPDRATALAAAPAMSSQLPGISALRVDSREITKIHANKWEIVCNYVGYKSTSGSGGGNNEITVNYAGGSGIESIQSHPRFKEWAGDPRAETGQPGALIPYKDPAGNESDNYLMDPYGNGAQWLKKPVTFINFIDPGVPELYNVQTYITATDQVTVTYNSSSAPSWNNKGGIFPVIPINGVSADSKVTNWILADISAQQIGTVGSKYFKITELYLGSPNENGWDSTKIYPVVP